MALMDNDWTSVLAKVGMEPSGDPFNSIMKLETYDTKKPSNPMINAGAIVTTSLIKGNSVEEKEERMLQFFRRLANNDSIGINYEVYKSEKLTGDRNRALAYFMKSSNIFEGNVEDILDLYFKQCSIEIDCVDLARIGINLAKHGLDIETYEISEALGRGKHTTRHVELYEISDGYIADTPGFSAIDLKDMNKEQLRDTFIEFRECECKFRDCMHHKERDCGGKNALEDKMILQSRYNNYLLFLEEVDI